MNDFKDLTIGVLALQGAFEEHQQRLEALGCKTRQVCSNIFYNVICQCKFIYILLSYE